MKRTMLLMAVIAIGLVIAAVRADPPAAQASDCRKTSVGLTPLIDLGATLYQGYPGGLYGQGQNVPPAAHLSLAESRSALIKPLGTDGAEAAGGKIVLLSIGMSNTTQEFSQFADMAKSDAQVNPSVLVVDGAQGGQDAKIIRDPAAQFWTVVDERLAAAGASRAQVQAVWLKQAESRPTGPFPESAQELSADLQAIVGILHARYPNLGIVYLSSRTYGGYASTALNPEPYAYESGFAVKWLIDKQTGGDPALNADPAKGVVRAPVLLWGPYLWADGLTPRSDRLFWRCEDFAQDGTHPGPAARQKVANLLMTFFKTDGTARPWFMSDPQATPLPLPTIDQPATLTPGPRPTGPRPTMDPTRMPTPRSYRVKETPSGDQMWITTSSRMVQRQLERMTPGQEAWLCGQVVADAAVEWGFRFSPDRLAIVPIAPPANQSTIKDIAADPGAANDTVKCIKLEAATEWVEGTPPATGTPGTPMPTPGTGPGPGPGTGTPTRTGPLPTRPGRLTPTRGPGTGTPVRPRRTPSATATVEPSPALGGQIFLPMLFRGY